MNSDNQNGAFRVIHNAIDVAPNEEMFEPSLFAVTEHNQTDLLLPCDLQNSALRVAFYNKLSYRQRALRLLESLRNHAVKLPASPFQLARPVAGQGERSDSGFTLNDRIVSHVQHKQLAPLPARDVESRLKRLFRRTREANRDENALPQRLCNFVLRILSHGHKPHN
jgi:hypothetical protein